MAMIYDMLELATAVKPWLLQHLLETDDVVCYLDPDIEVFASLDEIERLALRHSIVLTPHTTTPMPRDGLIPSEQTIRLAGVFNLGFIAVSRDAQPFLAWWTERLRRECRIAVAQGLFVDQRWIDFVPAYFEHTVLARRGLQRRVLEPLRPRGEDRRRRLRGERPAAALLPLQRFRSAAAAHC